MKKKIQKQKTEKRTPHPNAIEANKLREEKRERGIELYETLKILCSYKTKITQEREKEQEKKREYRKEWKKRLGLI